MILQLGFQLIHGSVPKKTFFNANIALRRYNFQGQCLVIYRYELEVGIFN